MKKNNIITEILNGNLELQNKFHDTVRLCKVMTTVMATDRTYNIFLFLFPKSKLQQR